MTAGAQPLAAWLQGQRWFQGKDRTVDTVTVVDSATLLSLARWLLAEVRYERDAPELYQLVLVDTDDAAHAGTPTVTVEGSAWTDATADPVVLGELARLAAGGGRIPTERGGVIEGLPCAATHVPADGRPLGVEQSNTSVVFGGSAVLKLFRRLDTGVNPDIELTAALTRVDSADVPAQIGALTLRREADDTPLGVVSTFVARGRDAWRLAVADASEALVYDATPPGDRDLIRALGELGAATSRVHADLARALPSRAATRDDVEGWVAEVHQQVDWVLGERPIEGVDTAALHGAVDAAADQIDDAGVVSRIHGDLHLGQVLASPDGWKLLDFEGEPAAPVEQRRAPGPPARDIAGMLRSFDYAAAAGEFAAPVSATQDAASDAPGTAGLPAPLEAWRDAARDSYLAGYEAAAATRVDPAMLALFELHKAVYEIAYERAYRPDWLAIPAGGVQRILDRVIPDAQGTVSPTRGRQMASTAWHAGRDDVDALLRGTHTNPHRVLGLHEHRDGTVVRVLRPDVAEVEVVWGEGATTGDGQREAGTERSVTAKRTADGGLFEALVPAKLTADGYRLRMRSHEGVEFMARDPYAFWPTLGDTDLHLAGEGRHEELWRRLGAQVATIDGVEGTAFAVWAPNAQSVRVVGNFNDWDGRRHPMRVLGTGIWELFVPDVGDGTIYKYEVLRADGDLTLHADPFAFHTQTPPDNASRVFVSTHEWQDGDWMTSRPEQQWHEQPLSIYEVHLGSWRHDDGRPLTYRELAHQLADHADELGFTHVEMLPVAEHPFAGSWGYQVTGQFAPTSRFGSPDDFRYLINHLHQRGVGVIVDWVPAHFPKDEWALARFDGTALYEHADPRQGEHPDWGTLVYNFGRNEVRNFLLASALYWLEELHVDGLRVDAVASMLYLDYSREEGEWVPNAYGGNENLEAIEFLKQTATTVYGRNPGALLIAEESTAWPGVSRPVHLGGLGFGFKWNMGWMHDTLSYFSRDPIHRRFHHNELTFGLLYAWSENYVLPLSHDEVVHGKRSLLDKMPGDRWQQFANLRALYGYMWAHPGKQLLFMGGEFGQWREWSEDRPLDWDLLAEADHRGLRHLVGDLNHAYRELPSLWERDHDPEGFRWIDANNADANLLSFVRYSADGQSLVCIVNLSPVPRDDQRFGMPQAGRWRERLNTDAESYGGGNLGNMGVIEATDEPWHGMTASAQVFVPPLTTLWLVPDDAT
ncbi:MAG TPA: 1,4-alpha-glucan branching protein GlgB [Euzebyales bacterium]|nr:1,4-alpha-glucan branching protein GlgB [Euzebyales bacterium]